MHAGRLPLHLHFLVRHASHACVTLRRSRWMVRCMSVGAGREDVADDPLVWLSGSSCDAIIIAEGERFVDQGGTTAGIFSGSDSIYVLVGGRK